MKTAVEMSALKTAATESANAFLKMVKTPGSTAEDRSKAEELLQKAVDAYNSAVSSDAHELCSTNANPVLELLTTRTYGGKIKVKKTLDKATKALADISIIDDEGEDPLELKVLDRFAESSGKQTYMTDALWLSKITKLRLPFAAAATRSIDGDMSKFFNAFHVSADHVGEYKGRAAKFDENFSVNHLQKLTQEALNAVIYEKKADDKDVNKYLVKKSDINWMILALCKTNRTDDLVMPNLDTFVRLFTRMASAVVSGVAYTIDYNMPK